MKKLRLKKSVKNTLISILILSMVAVGTKAITYRIEQLDKNEIVIGE